MRARTPILILTAGLVMLACHQAPPQAATAEAEPERGPDYLGWRRITQDPQHLAPALDVMCDSPPEYRMKSPHKAKVFFVYVNKLGEKAMMSAAKNKAGDFLRGPNEAFPDGSVIVKEKWPREAFGPDLKKATRPKTEPDLLTVMTKTKGKWVYSVVKNGLVQAGDMAHCAKCHESARATDYVFRSYEFK